MTKRKKRKKARQDFILLNEGMEYLVQRRTKGTGVDYLQTWTMKTGPSQSWTKPDTELLKMTMDGNGNIQISGRINLETTIGDLGDLVSLSNLASSNDGEHEWFGETYAYEGIPLK